MEHEELTTEELETISRLQAEKDAAEHYTERPLSQRILAWILLGIVLVGIALYCWIQVVPQI